MIVFTLLLQLLFSCSDSPDLVNGESGGVTETMGLIVCKDGLPSPSVQIQFVPTDHVPHKGDTGFITRTSNSRGEYFFATIPDGEYNLLYKKDGVAAFRDSLTISDGAVKKTVMDTLLPFGSISGMVRLHEKHNSGNVFILIRGTNRFLSPVDSTGVFTIDSLAEGEYTITFIADYDYYAQYDTTLMVVQDINDTLSDTIRLEYLGIETPTICATEYDSSLLHATVRWNAVNSGDLAGYQVFRKANHPDSVPHSIAYMWKDTFFIDSCDNNEVANGEKYLYQVSSINGDGMSGKLSQATSVIFKSLFSISDSLELDPGDEPEFVSMMSNDEGTIYLVRSNESKLHKIDGRAMAYLSSYDLPEKCLPTDISHVGDGSLLIASHKGVYNIDTTGVRIWRYSAYHKKPENSGGGQFTRYVSSLNEKYFYYTASTGLSGTSNKILRFNCEGGKSDTFQHYPNRIINSFYVEPKSEMFYLLSTVSDSLIIEQTQLQGGKVRELYRFVNGGDTKMCHQKDGALSLLNKKQLITLDTKTGEVLNQTFLPDDSRALTTLPTGERVLYRKGGRLLKVSKKR